ncbi:Coiled-coil domain-containing protein [Fasciola gigantica]|uniref:Coiled-coil domain-containing protein n=1 Tax=Fasciola gigantica TaxID=46835 RepID=A0A504YJB0_FASGI|nr:Coiled-coil domain-containing protein [Fasciola gigantica]
MKGKNGKMIEPHILVALDALKTDLSVISKKLESKTQAVVILHEALEQCKKERDEFRQMAEQVMNRYQLLRKTLSQGTQSETLSAKALGQMPSKKLAYLLIESREANRALERELVEINTKLTDAEGDIKLLRQQLRTSFNQSTSVAEPHPIPNDERQNLISHLERLTAQVNELERELSRCTDEKHELVTERDVYRNKCDRLNNELNYVLHGDERKIVDIDTLIMEKKSLKYRLQSVEEERNLAMSTLAKYKRMFERKASKSSSVGSDNVLTPSISPQHLCKLFSYIFCFLSYACVVVTPSIASVGPRPHSHIPARNSDLP